MIHVTAVDPDTHALAFAYLGWEDGKVRSLKVRMLKIGKSVKHREAALAMCQHPDICEAIKEYNPVALVVEGQDSRYTGKTNAALTRDLLSLALVAGAVVGQAWTVEDIYSPLPHAWKGSTPKKINQCRTLNRLGVKYTMKGGQDPYPVPMQHKRFCLSDNINPGDWKDINDALGLALFGLDKYLREKRLLTKPSL